MIPIRLIDIIPHGTLAKDLRQVTVIDCSKSVALEGHQYAFEVATLSPYMDLNAQTVSDPNMFWCVCVIIP